MTVRRFIYISAFVMLSGLTACSVEEPGYVSDDASKMPEMSADVVQGQLLVRFDARVSEILDNAGVTKSSPARPMTKSGVLSVDQILELVDDLALFKSSAPDRRQDGKPVPESILAKNSFLIDGLHQIREDQ